MNWFKLAAKVVDIRPRSTHVADLIHKTGKMFAIANGTSDIFEVDKVWYHPGTIRRVGDEYIRSVSPRVGKTYSRCPDVAVLRLKGEDDLPDALPLATRREWLDAIGLPIAILGYVSYDTPEFKRGNMAIATYHEGVINRVSDFQNDARVSSEDAQFLTHNTISWWGGSGSPMILPSGRVVGLNNSGETEEEHGRRVELSYGVRIDCLFELLTHHDLTSQVDGDVSVDKSRLARFDGSDPGLERTFRGIRLSENARDIGIGEGDYEKELKWHDEAARLAPNELIVQCRRAQAYVSHFNSHLSELSLSERGRILQEALQSAKKALKLDPAKAIPDFAKCQIAFDKWVSKSTRRIPQLLTVLLKLVENPRLSNEDRALIYFTAAQGCDWTKDTRRAYDFATKAITYEPLYSCFYSYRAYYGRKLGLSCEDDDLKAARLSQANKLVSRANFASSKKEYQSVLDYCDQLNRICPEHYKGYSLRAWVFATARQDSMRNGQKAVELATKACEMTLWKETHCLDVLAVAYAEVRDFESAIKWQQEARRFSPWDYFKDVCDYRIASYRKRRPIRF